MQRLLLFLLAFVPLAAHGHIGSPNVIYEGLAGPYPLRVVVRPPGVVPGLAEITVRVLQGDATRVTVLPVRYDTGSKGAPAPDAAKPVRGEPGLYSAELWFMTSGAHSVFVNVEGPAGSGTTIVPINSIATTRLEMSPWFGIGLLAFGIFLAVAMISIVGAAVRESIVPPGEEPSRKWRPRLAMLCAALVLGALLLGGRAWWNNVDTDYRDNRLYRPEPIGVSFRTEGDKRILQLERLESRFGRPRLIPDHGKLMHVFLIRVPGQDAFAHLHPVRTKAHNYESVLPNLPSGTYRVYADVTHESGFTQTLTAHLSLDSLGEQPQLFDPASLTDPDDSWHLPLPKTESDSGMAKSILPDGLSAEWAGVPGASEKGAHSLRFRVLETNGTPAVLELYLGMQGHVVIEEENGAVFTHLHPFGNISMASQQRFVERERTKAGKPNLEVVCGLPAKGDAVVFPYEFPRPGQYKVWFQFKTHGRILTRRFDAKVQ